MAQVIRLTAAGGPEGMQLQEVAATAPGPGQVWLAQEAMGVNPLDVLQRKGIAPIPLPSGLGLEGAGRVLALGAGVDQFAVGDRVAYATGPLGAYASERLYPAERLVKLPEGISAEQAAAVLFKGITAQYLLTSTYAVGPGTTVLLYGASGGVGQLMASWAKHLGATVIGVVSKPQSQARALAAGCDQALVFDPLTLAAQLRAATGGRMADVVYDGLGKLSFAASLDCLRPRGLMVSFGATTGAPPAVEMATLNAKGSLYITRPSLAAHTATAAEYQQRATAVLQAVAQGVIQPAIGRRYALADVAAAHADLEAGRTQGAVVLLP
ncbi:NADPH2:quinone reductase [Comamonas sp. BIGb0152]|uniref:quinone oxidoreductase family protein n=1 Tax=Comamonas sp. BIGb0152 TaxID=2940601 RepID=UPI00216A701A|nr:quinone oxidoreductase [Comamonas sp. BIGb0152]MCS4295377.1 NADPH2:quinone reductase [Comamonas sp. BIGb0152]